MSQPEPRDDRDVERLVRAQLERGAETVDPRALLGGIQESLSATAPAGIAPVARLHRPRGAWKWMGAAAAAVLIATGFILLAYDRPALAKGEAVVREARRAHLLPIDRCYLV